MRFQNFFLSNAIILSAESQFAMSKVKTRAVDFTSPSPYNTKAFTKGDAMNKIVFQIFCFLVLALSYIVVFSTGKSQAAGNTFGGVIPFTTNAGRLGFFEQGTGRIFVYDPNFKECVFSGVMTSLGEPILQAARK
jgi:hypothetical protein